MCLGWKECRVGSGNNAKHREKQRWWRERNMVSPVTYRNLPAPPGTGHTLLPWSLLPHPPCFPWSMMAPLTHPLRSLREATMEAQGPSQMGHWWKRWSKFSSDLYVVFFFFPHSNLGSGRSQWGQGLAQCDTAENGSLLHPVLPRDSILLKMPWEFCYCWIWAEGKGALEMGRENSWQKKPRLTQVTRFTHLKTWTAPQMCSSLSISS